MAEAPERAQINRRGGYHHHHHNPHRGRYSGPKQVLDRLGVSDLREHLDKKREDRLDHVGYASPPPPDPNSYLQDPTREKRQFDHPKPINRRPNHRNDSNAAGPQQQTPIRNKPQQQSKDIQPINIKVNFSPSTGEHKYEFDEDTVLPKIKHVPDNKPVYYRGRGSFRGRGRGRGNYRRPNNNKTKDEQAATSESSAQEEGGDAENVDNENDNATNDEPHQEVRKKDDNVEQNANDKEVTTRSEEKKEETSENDNKTAEAAEDNNKDVESD